jgi:hypothetical protein
MAGYPGQGDAPAMDRNERLEIVAAALGALGGIAAWLVITPGARLTVTAATAGTWSPDPMAPVVLVTFLLLGILLAQVLLATAVARRPIAPFRSGSGRPCVPSSTNVIAIIAGYLAFRAVTGRLPWERLAWDEAAAAWIGTYAPPALAAGAAVGTLATLGILAIALEHAGAAQALAPAAARPV